MEKDLILTCDAGTTGCKCSVFNIKGEALSSVRRNYPTLYPRPNWAEQDADRILDAVFDGIRELLQQVSSQRIACVGLSGTMNGCIPVDEEGRALHPNIIHSDSRTGAQVEEINGVINKYHFYTLTGNRLDSHYTLPKIMWFKENLPDIYRRAKWFMNIKDYIYAHLTGRFGFTDYSDASLTTALDINNKCWAADLLKDLNVDIDRMPRIIAGHDIRGKITRNVYYRTGLITGTPVAIGGGNELSAYGLAHLGDYEATLFSPYSHNRAYGEALITGRIFEKLAEGVPTAKALKVLGEKYKVDLPITNAVYEICYEKREDESGKEKGLRILERLFSREVKSEFCD